MFKTTTRALAASFLLASAAHATSLGISSDPMGAAWDRGDADTAFGSWDTFSSYSFSNLAANSGGGFTILGLNQSITTTGNPGADQGAGIYNTFSGFSGTPGTDLIYNGARNTNFSVTGTTPFAIKGFTLQVKQAVTQASLGGLVLPTLNGIAADGFTTDSGTGDTTSSTGDYSVTTWYWGDSLAATTITDFTVAIAPTSTRTAFDGFVVDAGPVAAVPEPGTIALLTLAATGGLLLLRRRRAS
jgi:hypothetical protein